MNLEDISQGPVDPSLLHLQGTHRSTEIWRLGGGDSQKLRRRKPNQFPISDRRMFPLLQSTGFYGVARVASLQLDWSLLSALLERWRPETHTFHLPMGEVTITLQDVAIFLGLPVDGCAVMCDVSPGAEMSWLGFVGSIFGTMPTARDFNGSRV